MSYTYGMQGAPVVGGGLGGLPRRSAIDAGAGQGGAYNPLFSDVLLLMHCEGANGGTSFVDSSSFARTLTPTSFETSSAQAKFGATSARNTAMTAKIAVASSSDFAFGAGDFTAEAWIYTLSTGITQRIVSTQNAAGGGGFWLRVDSNGSINAYVGVTNILSAAAGVVTTNTWHHVAVSRSEGKAVLVIDGKIAAAVTATDSITSSDLYIGGNSAGGEYFNGYIDEVRITRNDGFYARYFLPTSAFPDK